MKERKKRRKNVGLNLRKEVKGKRDEEKFKNLKQDKRK